MVTPHIDRERPGSLQHNGRKIVHASWVGALVAVLACTDALGDDELASAFDQGSIIIEATENACYRFDVYLATRREQHLRGLMHVRELPEFSGMLFIYAAPATQSMWMKNTYISLDILFIRADGTIANIETDTEPLSLSSIRSLGPVSYVLELNAGTAARLHIDNSSRVHFP